jgi:hypothetical protein
MSFKTLSVSSAYSASLRFPSCCFVLIRGLSLLKAQTPDPRNDTKHHEGNRRDAEYAEEALRVFRRQETEICFAEILVLKSVPEINAQKHSRALAVGAPHHRHAGGFSRQHSGF